MEYKGIMTDVSAIPSGTPVEYKPGLIGLYQAPNDSHHATLLQYIRGDRSFVSTAIAETAAAAAVYDPVTGRYTYPLKDGLKMKILTGQTAKVLRRHVRNHILTTPAMKFGGKICTIGCDPEIFVLRGDGRLFNAFDFLPAKALKGSPLVTAYWDGFQSEFITQGQSCNAFVADSVWAGLKAVYMAAKRKDEASRLTIQNVFEISPETLANAAAEHVAFGCDPSDNAYGLCGQPCPDARMFPFRFAGGHIHFGYYSSKPKTFFPPIVKTLDAILGLASVGIADGIDDPRRRIMYGLPGEYRLPPHGLEYRTLSNFWLSHPALTFLIWEIGRMAFDLAAKGFGDAWNAEQDEVVEIIRTCNAKAARAVFERNEALFRVLMARSFSELRQDTIKLDDKLRSAAADKALSVIHGGLGSFIKEPDNIEANWLLKGAGWRNHAEAQNRQFIKVVASGVDKV